MKIRSSSSKPKQLFIVSQQNRHVNLVLFQPMVHEITCRQARCSLNICSLSPAVILKIRSRSPKLNQLFIVSQCYSHANLVIFQPMLHEITCRQALFGLNFGSLCLAVTLKIRPRSLNVISSSSVQFYFHANLVKIH